MSKVLQFGIPSFDRLFGRRNDPEGTEEPCAYADYGIQLAGQQPTSLSLIGPDGTGKSVYGLHLASQYMASFDDTMPQPAGKQGRCPRVLYVSTDLKYDVAKVMWHNFGLDKPNQRDFPFSWAYRRGTPNNDREVSLVKLDPSDIQTILEHGADPGKTQVHFVDLVSKTMGDDWGFINRLLAVLKMPEERRTPHLLVVDAVEGFETLVGEKDAFGEITSRRARIAQIMRTAGEKCHVCFIVEEPRADERFPEEFVTDVVVRLRNIIVNRYARRTVEIVKARGQAHVRGEHIFVIRNARAEGLHGTGNADEPPSRNSYVCIFPSLHYLSREDMKRYSNSKPHERNKTRVAAFGITYLDEMLDQVPSPPQGLDDQGLPVQAATALIGEVATQRTSLAAAFLARTFRVFTFRLADVLRQLQGSQRPRLISEALRSRVKAVRMINERTPRLDIDKVTSGIRQISRWKNDRLFQLFEQIGLAPPPGAGLEGPMQQVTLAAWFAEALEDNGAAVLVTTSDQDRERLVPELYAWLENSRNKALKGWPTGEDPLSKRFQRHFNNAVLAHLHARTICRRLELHDLSSAALFQIIQRSVELAQQKVLLRSSTLTTNVDPLPYSPQGRFEESWNVRVVLDDLSTLKDAYPEIGSDPIFLPFLLSFLEREGVTALIVDSQNARPDAIVTGALERELRALVRHKILTWRVPFFGDIRDAITLVPPYPGGLTSRVREVRWKEKDKQSYSNMIAVHPELELFSGLERGEPKPIPLEIRIYAETGSTAEYMKEVNEILQRLFTGKTGAESNRIIVGEAGQYEALRDFCNLQRHTVLDHTMILQVDEFWASSRNMPEEASLFAYRENSLYPLGRYLTEATSIVTDSKTLIPDRIADPYGVFQGPPNVAKVPSGPWQRRHYFTRSSQGWPRNELQLSQTAKIDRIPYTWDFGFLLCSFSMWEASFGQKIGYKNRTVKDVWAHMPNVFDREQQPYLSWRTFLGACKAVANTQHNRTSKPIRVLDVSTLSEESFSCLILEIWASEIYDMLPKRDQKSFFDRFGRIDWSSPSPEGLIEWLENEEYCLAFYKTWLLLIDAIELHDAVEQRTMVPSLKARKADEAAAATRHWYKTACGNQQCPVTSEPRLPVRLPGHFSVRGDWFLAVAGGSRSERLACRALDLFSTRRANFRRMEMGIGLPTRDIAPKESFDRLPTALIKRRDGRTTAVTYGELIGAGIDRLDHFSYLWRSQLRGYHQHSQLLQKWAGQMIAKWDDLRKELGPGWRPGFSIYDELDGKPYKRAQPILADLRSWKEFMILCELLKVQLKIASRLLPDAAGMKK